MGSALQRLMFLVRDDQMVLVAIYVDDILIYVLQHRRRDHLPTRSKIQMCQSGWDFMVCGDAHLDVRVPPHHHSWPYPIHPPNLGPIRVGKLASSTHPYVGRPDVDQQWFPFHWRGACCNGGLPLPFGCVHFNVCNGSNESRHMLCCYFSGAVHQSSQDHHCSEETARFYTLVLVRQK